MSPPIYSLLRTEDPTGNNTDDAMLSTDFLVGDGATRGAGESSKRPSPPAKDFSKWAIVLSDNFPSPMAESPRSLEASEQDDCNDLEQAISDLGEKVDEDLAQLTLHHHLSRQVTLFLLILMYTQ